MITEQEYWYAWTYYLIGAFIFIGCWWILTQKIPFRELRNVSRLVVIVALLVPWYTGPEMTFLSPAWIISVAEGSFEGEMHFGVLVYL